MPLLIKTAGTTKNYPPPEKRHTYITWVWLPQSEEGDGPGRHLQLRRPRLALVRAPASRINGTWMRLCWSECLMRDAPVPVVRVVPVVRSPGLAGMPGNDMDVAFMSLGRHECGIYVVLCGGGRGPGGAGAADAAGEVMGGRSPA